MHNTANMSHEHLPIPGSLVLVDVDGRQQNEHVQGGKDIVLSPVPSNDLNDPLRWSWKRKQIHNAMLVLCKWRVRCRFDHRYHYRWDILHRVKLRPRPAERPERRVLTHPSGGNGVQWV
jgi:hypothetical protein